jgi:hypothetical protein
MRLPTVAPPSGRYTTSWQGSAYTTRPSRRRCAVGGVPPTIERRGQVSLTEHPESEPRDAVDPSRSSPGWDRREVDVVPRLRRAAHRATEIGEVDEQIEVGACQSRLIVIGHAAPPASPEIDPETIPGGHQVDLLRTEQGDLHTGLLGEMGGECPRDLFPTSVGRPVQVVDADLHHFDRSH